MHTLLRLVEMLASHVPPQIPYTKEESDFLNRMDKVLDGDETIAIIAAEQAEIERIYKEKYIG